MPTRLERERAAAEAKAEAQRRARDDQQITKRNEAGEVEIDPDAAFAGLKEPESAEEIEAFKDAPLDGPYSRSGRDYYVDDEGNLKSVKAGADPYGKFPGWKPATADQVAERDLQKRAGSGWDQFDAGVEAFVRTGAEAVSGIGKAISGATGLPADVAPEKLTPFAYTDAALDRRDANPWSATGGAVAADLGAQLLLRGAGKGLATRRALVGGLTAEAGEVAVTGKPFSVTEAGIYGLHSVLLDGVAGVDWRGAMRALGNRGRPAVDGAVEAAQDAAIHGAKIETDPLKKAEALRENAQPIYERAQRQLDDSLVQIDEALASGEDAVFRPGMLKKRVLENLEAQGDRVLEIAIKLDHAAQVTGSDALREAADALVDAGDSGPKLFASLRSARKALSGELGDNPLAREVAQAVEDTLADEGLWGLAAKDHQLWRSAPPQGTTPLRVDDVGAREALDGHLARARALQRATGSKRLLTAIRSAEQAVVDADAVTGARLLGPERPPPVPVAPPLGKARQAVQKGVESGLTQAFGGAVGGAVGFAFGGGTVGGLAGTAVGTGLGQLASPYVKRFAERAAGFGRKNAGKLGAAALVGGAGAAAMSEESPEGFAAAGAGILAVPLLLTKAGQKRTLGELLGDYTRALEREATSEGARSYLGWEEKVRAFESIEVEPMSDLGRLLDSARDSLGSHDLTPDADPADIERAITGNYYFENRLNSAQRDFKSTQRKTTLAKNKAQKPSVIEAKKALGRVGEHLDGPFFGDWERSTWNGRNIARYANEGDTVAEVLKRRLKDKAPLTVQELAENATSGAPGGRRRYSDVHPDDPGPEFVYPETPEYAAARDAWTDRTKAFHDETDQLNRADLAALQAKIDEATAQLPEGDKVGRTHLEDGIIRQTLRDAMGMRPAPKRELRPDVDATSRYRKTKKGFDAWVQKALDEHHAKALKYWQSHEYRPINALVREGEEAGREEALRVAKMYKARGFPVKDLSAETAEILGRAGTVAPDLIEAMNHAIERGYTVPGRVTRGISMPAEEVERLLAAKTVTSQGFMSTSINQDVPTAFAERRASEFKEVPVMLTIEQKTGVPIGQGEGEVTLRPGTKFSIEWASRMNDGTVHAYLKEAEPSPLTKADMLRGIARSIPTEAKVAAGLLAVDAVVDDEDAPEGATAAGVGALALLFGGARRLRGISSRLSIAERKLGSFARTVDEVLVENEKTITSVANWGKSAERQPFADAVKNLTRHLEGRVAERDAAVNGSEAPYGRKYSDVRAYLEPAVEKRLAEAAGSAIGQRTAAPSVERLIEEYRDRTNPLKNHPLAVALGPDASTVLRERWHETSTRFMSAGYRDYLEAPVDVERLVKHIGNLTSDLDKKFVRAAIDHHYDLQSVEEGIQKRIAEVTERYKANWRGNVLEGMELTPEETELVEIGVKMSIAHPFEEALDHADFVQGGTLPARGIEVRAALRSYTEDPDLSGAVERGLGEQFYLAVADPAETSDALRYHQAEVARRKQQFTQTLKNYGLTQPAAAAVAEDLVAAVQAGRAFEAAVDDIAFVLDDAAAQKPLRQEEHRRLKESFDAWERAASERHGFSISRAIEDYAGDWDYKNINAYARGQAAVRREGGKTIAEKIVWDIEFDGSPMVSDLQKLAKQAAEIGDETLAHWVQKALDESTDEDLAALVDHLKTGDVDGAHPPLVGVATTQQGAFFDTRAVEKATTLQHALDLAVSDGFAAPGVTYRGVLLDEADLERIASADTVEAHAFMSTTADADYAARFISRKEQLRQNPRLREVLFEVVQKTGVPINTGESEVLLRAGTRFRVEPIASPSEVHPGATMRDSTRNKVKFRLVELDHDPKLPTQLDVKSALPWVAGGVLAIGALTPSDAAAAEEESPEIIPTEEADPERVMRIDSTRQKLDYLTSQSRSLTSNTARALVSPEAQKARKVAVRPGLTSSAGVAQFAGNQQDLRAAYEEKRSMLQRLERDPMALVEEMADSLADVGEADPDLQRQVVAKTYEIARFLQSKIPGTIGASLTRPEGTPPSPTAVRQFALYYSAATNPSSVYTDLANNRVRKEQVDTLKELWPEAYQGLKVAVVEQLSNGSRPSIQQRARLDLLFDFGGALDRGLSPRLAKALAEHRAQQPDKAPGAKMPSRRTNPSVSDASPLAGLSGRSTGLLPAA